MTAIHETFHFLGLDERYKNGVSRKGFENDVLGLEENIYKNGGIRIYQTVSPKMQSSLQKVE